MANLYGDVELGAKGMRALAHPARLAILFHLQQHGRNTATGLSPHVGVSPSVASWHLRHLAEHGLVVDAAEQGPGRQRWWEAVRGFRFAGIDEESSQAARTLQGTLEAVEGDIPGRWRAEVEPYLDTVWRRSAGRANTVILITADELQQLQADLERLLAPYVLRKDQPEPQRPGGARAVRILTWIMPTRTADTDRQPAAEESEGRMPAR